MGYVVMAAEHVGAEEREQRQDEAQQHQDDHDLVQRPDLCSYGPM